MGVVIPFPGCDRRKRAAPARMPGNAEARPQTGSLSRELRELRRMFGLPLDGLLEVGPDGRALRAKDLQDHRVRRL